jgi:hypothetical protein
MDPAYIIPLNQKELALLGELTVIMGQIDDMMIQTVQPLLGIDRAAANVILGSSKIGDNAAIWANVIRNRTEDEDILWLVEIATKEIKNVSEGRNDFIHAVFTTQVLAKAVGSTSGAATVPIPFNELFERMPPTARRVRKDKPRSIAELTTVRDQAGRLSCLIAHIHLLMSGTQAEASPWLQTLSPTLPPRLGTVASRKVQAQRVQRPPSQTSQREQRRARKRTPD